VPDACASQRDAGAQGVAASPPVERCFVGTGAQDQDAASLASSKQDPTQSLAFVEESVHQGRDPAHPCGQAHGKKELGGYCVKFQGMGQLCAIPGLQKRKILEAKGCTRPQAALEVDGKLEGLGTHGAGFWSSAEATRAASFGMRHEIMPPSPEHSCGAE
jgi:hypothetical protein